MTTPATVPTTIEILIKVNDDEPTSFGDPAVIDVPIKVAGTQITMDLTHLSDELAHLLHDLADTVATIPLLDEDPAT